MIRRSSRRGAALLISLFTLMVVMLLTGAVLQSLLAARRQARRSESELQAQWLAEAAVSRAIARLATQPDYSGESWRVTIAQSSDVESIGMAEIRIEKDSTNRKRIIVVSHYPDDPIRQVTAQRDYTIRTKY
jgi:type II secretory pathway component PulK